MIHVPNLHGKTPLTLAIEKGCTPMVKTLLEKGVHVHTIDPEGSTPLHIASSWGYYDIVTLLMLHHANLGVKNRKGFTPLDYAYSEEMKNHLIHCAECIKANKPIVTPKRKEPEVNHERNQQATAYVSYLKTLF